ncbi:MAG: CheR family methyltransferase [Planctomycetota bacterium]
MSPPRALLGRFRQAVARVFGLELEGRPDDELLQALEARARARRLTPGAYLDRLAEPEEQRALAQALTVGETYLFRDLGQLAALEEVVLPRLAERPFVRALSAGCASGEEVWTLALLLRERLGAGPEGAPRAQVRGLDLRADLIERARAGRYGAWSLRQLPARWRDALAREDDDHWRVDPSLAPWVSFALVNLKEEHERLEVGAYDLIFCRNVLMYFVPAAARAIVQGLVRALRPGGALFVGHAESLRELHGLEVHEHAGAFFYWKPDGAAPLSVPRAAGAPGDLLAVRWEAPRAEAGPAASSWPAPLVLGPAAASPPACAPAGPTHAAPEEAVEQEDRAPPAPWDPAPALAALAAERFDEVLALTETSEASEALLLRAAALMHRGALEDAARELAALNARDELCAQARYLAGRVCALRGEDAPARDHLRAAIYLDPRFALPHLELASLARRGGDAALALRSLRRALDLLPEDDPERLRLLGGFGRPALEALTRAELRVLSGGAA